MDLLVFWDNINFVPKYKEKGHWVMSATVDSGNQLQLKVISKNKATKLRDMEWKYIYGIQPQENETVQYFIAPYNTNLVLSIISENRNEIVYGHKWEKYIITKKLNSNVVDMNVHNDNAKLVDIITTPSFTIKHL